MSYRIITCEESEIISEDIWEVCNKKCNDALSADEAHIAVQLRPEMGGGVPLLDWIAKWRENFLHEGKTLYIISDDPQQQESMELSHPDQNLVFVTSEKEFKDQMRLVSPEVTKVIEEKKVAVEDTEEKEVIDSTGSQTPVSIEDQKQAVFMAVGEIVEIAGEYICQSCGATRMWMKGKTVTGCQNPECFDPSKGWKLDFDLF